MGRERLASRPQHADGTSSVSRIAITEDDLDATSSPPAVYGPVGGTTHPNVYGPVTAPPPSAPQHGELAVATWVLITAAAVLCVTFGIGGFFAGRSGQVSKSEQQEQLQVVRDRLETERLNDVRAVRRQTQREERNSAQARVARAREESLRRGRAEGLAEGREQGRTQLQLDSFGSGF
jgi:hypothetical protein